MGAKWPLKDELTIGCNLEHNGYMLSLITYLFGNIKSIRKINIKYSEESLATPDYYYSILNLNATINYCVILSVFDLASLIDFCNSVFACCNSKIIRS